MWINEKEWWRDLGENDCEERSMTLDLEEDKTREA